MRQLRRLKQTKVKEITIRPRIVTKDSEGVPVISWGDPFTVKGEIWPATSSRQIEQYGDRVSGIQNALIEGDYTLANISGVLTLTRSDGQVIRLGDGVCVYNGANQDPDYEVLSIRETDPLRLEIEVRYG